MSLLKTLTLATSLLNLYVERAPDLCCGWSETTDTSLTTNHRVQFQIHVKEKNRNLVQDLALHVSDPASSSYGEYLTTETIDALTAPAESDLATITAWLGDTADVTVTRGRTFHVDMDLANAEILLSTTFRKLVNEDTDQATVLSNDYSIPQAVRDATDTIMGLHGLPLPPRTRPTAPPAQPAKVTPAVIISQYDVNGVTAKSGSGNKQAVAEFQGQTMSSTDLKQFFKQYVPNAPPGSDTVSKFVGDGTGDKVGTTEASLDIQYIMGVAPGIPTEFWLYNPMDFCADLKNWTTTLLADDTPPLVTSVSYGIQGNLTQIGCKQRDIETVDADFAKLAAKGLTIIFASGDSGSGYNPHKIPNCAQFRDDTELEGTVLKTTKLCVQSFFLFIFFREHRRRRPSSLSLLSLSLSLSLSFSLLLSFSPLHPLISLFLFFPRLPSHRYNILDCCISAARTYSAWTWDGPSAPSPGTHTCTVYSNVTGHKSASGKISSVAVAPAGPVTLWPSWPASSPWVTSVGATRFVGQTAGNEEMATDQFGSGGGFSSTFNQSPNAMWQSKDVANYLNVVPKGAPFPPSKSFNALGRATPDVSALGEGFQVLQNGRVMAVGGTSASAPTFAAIVSLLNEHQLQQGKKPLGFLNPFIYANQDAFTDVTKGTNAIGRGTGPIKCVTKWTVLFFFCRFKEHLINHLTMFTLTSGCAKD